MLEILQGLFGVSAILALCWAVSENRPSCSIRLAGAAILLQIAIAVVLWAIPATRDAFELLTAAVAALQRSAEAGSSFVFGFLGGGPAPFEETQAGGSFILAFRVLPLILVIGALSALLYHYRVIPAVVGAFAWALRRLLGLSGPAGFGVAANVFVGMVESPLLIRPYLKDISRADLFLVMTAGMATIAGTVMVIYAAMLGAILENALGHILTASLMNLPSAVAVSRLLIPAPPSNDEESPTPRLPSLYRGPMDAIVQGAEAGLKLLLTVAAMLLVFVALVHLVNQGLAQLPSVGAEPLSLQRILGWALSPLAWLIGIPWTEAPQAGALLGAKIVLNEFIAYSWLAGDPGAGLSAKSHLILVYALCGFANLGSLGILAGGLGALCPERRSEIVELGPKTILSGLLATCLSGAVIGILSELGLASI